MDWIQIYLLFLIVVGALLAAKKEVEDFWLYLSALIITLPFIGRFFGWW